MESSLDVIFPAVGGSFQGRVLFSRCSCLARTSLQHSQPTPFSLCSVHSVCDPFCLLVLWTETLHSRGILLYLKRQSQDNGGSVLFNLMSSSLNNWFCK